MSVRRSLAYELFPPDLSAVDECVHRRASAARFTLMGALGIVSFQPGIELEPIGNMPPAEVEAAYHRQQEESAEAA